MREIKFRVWNPHSKSMISQYHAVRCDGSLMTLALDEVFLESDISNTNEVVMQYTGLKDRNDREIYEGDIVEINGIKRVIHWLKQVLSYSATGISDYNDYTSGKDNWIRISNQGGYNLHLSHADCSSQYIEVIGNIYQNPELTK